MGRVEVARIHPFDGVHARVCGKTGVELAVADIDRMHARRATRQQHLREAARRRAKIERHEA